MRKVDRTAFMLNAARMGLGDHVVERLTRLAVTHDRLAEAECNGDWPCDNGERKVTFCSRCESGYVPSKVIRGQCESCRTEERIKSLLFGSGVAAEFSGDPRGWTVKLVSVNAAKERAS